MAQKEGDIKIGGRFWSTTTGGYIADGEQVQWIPLTTEEFNALKKSGSLKEGVLYMITDEVKVSNLLSGVRDDGSTRAATKYSEYSDNSDKVKLGDNYYSLVVTDDSSVTGTEGVITFITE